MKALIASSALICSMAFGASAIAAPTGKNELSGSTLSEIEISNLQFMREEEKLARDVYLTLNEYWGTMTSVFSNIALSEESHTSTINYLLDKYDVEDPVASNEVGVFTNPELQELYHALVEKGSASLVDGLYVGALIEEVDMRDIVAAIDATDERAMILAYSNLLDGSKNHLRAFVSAVESEGLVYEAQVLDANEVQLILESEDH